MSKSKTLNRAPQCFVVSAPSGGGKTTLVLRALKELSGIEKTISHTTRAPRPSEKDGQDYYFIDHRAFEKEIQNGGFVEHAVVYDEFYGTSVKTIEDILQKGHDVILVIENHGAKEIKKRFEHVVTILIAPPSLAELEKRLRSRGVSDNADVSKRLAKAKDEFAQLQWFDYVVINDDLVEATQDLLDIIRASRLQLPVYSDFVRKWDE